MNSIAELLAEFRAGRMTPDGILDALTLRGVVPEDQHREEIALLEQLRDEAGGLDPQIVQALLTQLASVQSGMARPDTAPPARPAPGDDATVVQPRTPMPPRNPSGEEVTVFQAAPRVPPAVPVAGDMTVVRPGQAGLSRPAAAGDGARERTPPQRAEGPSTDTSTSSSSSQSTWQRVAVAAGGDFVEVGSLLKGRFYLEKEIGRGGMGVVYKARDERKVEARDRDPYLAVKVLNDEFRRHPDSLIALQRESRRSQLLAHDNIVRVFDFDKDGTVVFMTMEYIDGSDLKGVIRERAFNGLPLKEARPLIEGMARGLARAHAEGVVHSDFKPGNVMVTRNGVPKVFDFGIARAGKMGEAVGEQTVFDASTLGALTPAYASLEMIQGREPEARDDIYALGCVVFELLTGKHPFEKLSAEVAQKEGRTPPPVPGLTKRQYKALSSAVAFTREKRLKNAMDLIEGLRELSLGERSAPYLRMAVPAAVVLVGGAWGLVSYLHSSQMSSLIAGFGAPGSKQYANEDDARRALDKLSEDDRKRVIIDQSEAIQNYLIGRIDAYWNPDKGRFDYGKAQKIFAFRDQLKLYSPLLDAKRAEVEKQRNDALNSLDTALTAQIGAGSIFDTPPDNNAVGTLGKIQAVDPSSGLLKNAQLELKYDAAIGKSLDDGRIDEARHEFELANRFFADSPRIQQRAVQVDELGKVLVAQQAQQKAIEQTEREQSQALQTLAGLIDHPIDKDDWRNKVADAYRAAKKLLDGDSRLDAQSERLKTTLTAQVKDKQTAGQATAAIDIAGFEIDMFPGDATLSTQRQVLLDAQNKIAEEAQTKAQLIAKDKARITELLGKPLGTAAWLQDVTIALNEARTQFGAESPDFAAAHRNVVAGLSKLGQDRVAAKDVDGAERIARAAQQIDATAPEFVKLAADVAATRTASANQIAQAQAQKLADSRKQLGELIAKPTLTADWQSSVLVAMDGLKADTAPETKAQVSMLGDAIAAEAAKLSGPQQLPQAKLAVEFGLKLVPKSPKLIEQRANLEKLAHEAQAKADQETAEAEVKSRIESVKSAAAANDIPKARESLARIRVLHPDDAFLKTEGPKLLSDAYLRFAADTFARKNYQDAADVLGQAIKVAGDRPELRAAKARYELVAAIKKAGGQPPAQADYDRLKKQVDDLRQSDATGLGDLEAGMRQRNQLPEKTLADAVEKLKPGLNAAPGATPAPGTPGAEAAPGENPKPGATTKPKAGAVPGQVSGQAGVAGPSGPDPCAMPELVGKSKICYDQIDTVKGPRLVVVPGVDGGKAYAMARTEISVINFNDFCNASKKCAAKTVEDADFGNAPIANINISMAQSYAGWLTSATGYVYRLPTEAEWSNAAKAGGGFKQAEDSNCVPPGVTEVAGAPVSAKGRAANPWGLVNMSGNVWEWTVTGGKIVVRGASFAEYWSDCTVDARRDDSGEAKKDVGFRILRELK